jgi:two-component system sensor histidine kinase ChiS
MARFPTRILPPLAACCAVAIVLSAVALLERSERKRFIQRSRTDVLNRLSALRASLEGELNQRIFLSRGIVTYVSTVNPEIDQATFEELARVLVARSSGIPSAALFKNSIATHLYPLKGQEEALGFDPMNVPEEREAFERAIATRSTVLAGPVKLVKGGMAFITRTPIFLTPPGAPPESGPYWGMVSIGIDRDILFREAGLLEWDEQLLYSLRGKDGRGAEGEVFFGNPQIFDRSPVILNVTLPNGSWQLAAVPIGGWPENAPISRDLWLGGGLLALVAGSLTFVLVSTPMRLKTAVERATAALRESESALKQANRSLQQLDKLKDEFLANTSHELRTPLNGIIGITQSLLDGATGGLPDATRRNLETIVASGRRLATLVNDILDFAKLKHNNLQLQVRSIALRELVEVVFVLIRPLIGAKPLTLIADFPENLPPVAADENRLQQIFYNLIGNAIKFTDAGEIVVSARSPNPSDPETVEIAIRDTGIGIEADKLDRIFESFEQADGSTAREYGGTGLGLAVTKQLVELHGGRIAVESQIGVGSTFTFTLPVSRDGWTPAVLAAPISGDRDRPVAAASPSDALVPAELSDPLHHSEIEFDGRDLKILIVDDEPINCQVLVNYLSLYECELAIASNGVQALELLATSFKPDLILLDVMMPRMTGYQVCQQIRERYSLDELPIIMLTAKDRLADVVMGLESGANDYLSKPIAKAELLARIRTQVQLCHLETLRRLSESEREKAAALERSLVELKQTQAKLIQSEKMSSLGQLVAGIAHEINNPVSFIHGNLDHVEDYARELIELVDRPREDWEEKQEDLDFIREDLPKLLDSMKNGTRRIRQIVSSLRDFSQLDRSEFNQADICEGLDSTLVILQSRLHLGEGLPDIQVIKKYDKIPKIECYPSQLNQVFLNILTNAIDALQEKYKSLKNNEEAIAEDPKIEITVNQLNHRWIEIAIADNGPGIPEQYLNQLFNPFFTTKPVGKGMGLSLSTCYQIVAEGHGGQLECTSAQPGRTQFTITLPVEAVRSSPG